MNRFNPEVNVDADLIHKGITPDMAENLKTLSPESANFLKMMYLDEEALMEMADRNLVARREFPNGVAVDTVFAEDTGNYETGLFHPEYRSYMKTGRIKMLDEPIILIVEEYKTKEEAVAGQAKWEAHIVNDTLPDEIEDCLSGRWTGGAVMIGIRER